MIYKPCAICGEVSEESRCKDHRLKQSPNKPTAEARGYDGRWKTLSKRARTLQPFCSVCFTADDLQADHLPSAWERKEQGKAIRLKDIQVLCGACNRNAGSARAGSARAKDQGSIGPAPSFSSPRPRQNVSYSQGVIRGSGS